MNDERNIYSCAHLRYVLIASDKEWLNYMQNGCYQKMWQPDKPGESSRRAQIMKQLLYPNKTLAQQNIKGFGYKSSCGWRMSVRVKKNKQIVLTRICNRSSAICGICKGICNVFI